MKKYLLLLALLPLFAQAQSTQRIEADNILLQTRTPQISNTSVTVNGTMKITSVANGGNTDSVLVIANGTLKRIARSAFSEFVSKTIRDTIIAPKNFTRYVYIDSLYGRTFNQVNTNPSFDQLSFRPSSGGIVSPYLKASASDNGTQRVRSFFLPSTINDDTLATKTDLADYVPQSRTINGVDLSANRTLTTNNISEGDNLYYTNARARQAISLTTTGSGAATYNNSTGVLNVPTNTGFDTTVTRQPFTFLGRKSGTGGWSQQQYFDTTWFNNLFATYVRAAQNNSSANPAGSNGQIQFNNSGSFGASSNLNWDNANNRLGINRTATAYTLEVGGNIGIQGDAGIVQTRNINHPAIGFGTTGYLGSNTTTGWSVTENFAIGQVGISNTSQLYILASTISGTATKGIFNANQTWNTTGSPTAIAANITNTASGANARLMNLSVGGTTQFAVDKVGKLLIATGTNASVGFATLSSGTVTVNTTAVSASSGISITVQESGTNNGRLRISAKVAGTSFTITSSDSGDNCTVFYQIIN